MYALDCIATVTGAKICVSKFVFFFGGGSMFTKFVADVTSV